MVCSALFALRGHLSCPSVSGDSETGSICDGDYACEPSPGGDYGARPLTDLLLSQTFTAAAASSGPGHFQRLAAREGEGRGAGVRRCSVGGAGAACRLTSSAAGFSPPLTLPAVVSGIPRPRAAAAPRCACCACCVAARCAVIPVTRAVRVPVSALVIGAVGAGSVTKLARDIRFCRRSMGLLAITPARLTETPGT